MTVKTLIATAVIAAVGAPAAGASTINIPAIHVHNHVTMNLNAGPAWWPNTARPGHGDTIAIAGHRTTHTRPFHNLNKLRPGNRIIVRYQNHTYIYVVTSRQIVSARNTHIADGQGYERLLLTACTRPDGTPTSADWRIVIHALPLTP